LENREDLALNVYVAMCYYKLDYYDVSLEILAVYLQVIQKIDVYDTIRRVISLCLLK
jgi:hypothetical protein